MQVKYIGAACMLSLSACVTSEDPADGGFFNGVSGLSSGTYDERVTGYESDVANAQSRNAALTAQQQALQNEIRGAEGELAKLKLTILNQKIEIGALDTNTSERVDSVLNARPSGSTDHQRLAALQKTISDAKALSADLARLAG